MLNAFKSPADIEAVRELGREYVRSWNYDGDDFSTVCKVVKRTPQFVTIQERGDRERRCKINICNGVENIHPDSLMGYYANEVLPTEEEREEQRKQEEAERQEREQRQLETAEAEALEIVAIIKKFPHEDGRPFVRVEWVEGYDCTIKVLCGKNLSIIAADMILGRMDNRRHNDPDFLGYDKCNFTLYYNEENYTDRYDLGDGYGGLIKFLSSYDSFPADILSLLAEDEKKSLEAVKKAAQNHEAQQATTGGKVISLADYKKRKEEEAAAEKKKENEEAMNGLEISISTLTAPQTSAAIDNILAEAEKNPASWAIPALGVIGKMLQHYNDIAPGYAYQKYKDIAPRIKALQIAIETSNTPEDTPQL